MAAIDRHHVASGDDHRVPVGVSCAFCRTAEDTIHCAACEGHPVPVGAACTFCIAAIDIPRRAAVDGHRIATGISAGAGASAVGLAADEPIGGNPAPVLDDEMIPCHAAALIVAAVRNPRIGHAVHGQRISREGSGGVRESGGNTGAKPFIRHGVSRVRRRIPRV